MYLLMILKSHRQPSSIPLDDYMRMLPEGRSSFPEDLLQKHKVLPEATRRL